MLLHAKADVDPCVALLMWTHVWPYLMWTRVWPYLITEDTSSREYELFKNQTEALLSRELGENSRVSTFVSYLSWSCLRCLYAIVATCYTLSAAGR